MSKKVINLEGLVFGRLTVVRRSPSRRTPNGTLKTMWECRCSCGGTTTLQGQALRTGNSRSCGCLQKELTGARSRTHGLTGSPEYESWRGMWERCTNPNNNHYRLYGAAGIQVCDSWKDFQTFLSDMGERPEGTTLDRFPNAAGNYEPGNCRWATPGDQNRNTSRTVSICWKGETKCLKDWASTLGITGIALKYRIKHWGIERAMSEPRKNRGRSAANNKEKNNE